LRSSATAFKEHVHLLTEARSAFQEAISASTELRHWLDVSDEALKSVMTQLQQVINDHMSVRVPDRKKPALVRSDPSATRNDSIGTGTSLP
jgi:uncharacterized protein HemX